MLALVIEGFNIEEIISYCTGSKSSQSSIVALDNMKIIRPKMTCYMNFYWRTVRTPQKCACLCSGSDYAYLNIRFCVW